MLALTVLVIFASLACSLGKSIADSPVQRCYTLDQLQGRLVLIENSGNIIDMKFSNDNQQKAMRFTAKNFDTILLYSQGVQYTIVNNGKSCHRSKLDLKDYHPIAMSDNFHLMGEGQLAGELEVQAYGVKSNGTASMMVVSKRTCVPGYVITKAANQTAILMLLDVSTCVDLDAFHVPAICRMVSPDTPRSDEAVSIKRGLPWILPHGK